MTSNAGPRATEIFLAAASLPADGRRSFLDRQCGGNRALRAEVEKLLANDKDDSFLEKRAAPTQSAGPAGSAPTLIGPYRVLSRLGEGGMGEVFLAERKDIGQRVALKLIKLGMDTRAILARFEAERQALARMAHSNIAKVLDAGATSEGRPYFVMEYVKGAPITRYCDDNRLSVEDRLLLFKQVCSGVQHAHSKGVIHRDLTPNNVLVTVQDGKPTAKIIDFGLARATDHRLTEKTIFTEQGVVMGTPEYMSPEQAGLQSLDIDTRTDVYTLGVMLYELLTGELPFSREELRAAGYEGMCRTIRDKEPEKPSTRITRAGTAKVAQLRRTESDRLLKRLRGDLDWVVLKCLEKDRTRRYDTPIHLADDLQRHLDDEVVMARAPSAGYRLQKLARKYRGQLLAAVAVLVALIAGLAGTTWFALEASSQADAAEKERIEAKRQEGIAQQQAREAAANAATAQRNAELFAGKVREFDQLAGNVYLERALATEKDLYPAWPHKIAAMKRWLAEDVGRLLKMQPEIEATVAALRGRALSPTSEEIEHDKATHPQFGQRQKLAAQLAGVEHAHRVRNGAELKLPLPTSAEQAMTAKQLNELAWPRVDFDEGKRIWGEEARGLMLARLAWDKVQDADAQERAEIGDTLAWAWFANGNDAEAIAQSEAALALAPDAEKETHTGHLTSLKAKVQAATGEAGAEALASLREQLTQLTSAADTRRTYRFADESQRFLHDTLSELQGDLAALGADERKSVVERLSWAERIESLTLGHAAARVTWQAARDAIKTADGVVASALYRVHPLDLRPQMGLVPMGMNPATKLWEFYELRSAWDGKGDPAAIEIPQHVKDGDKAGHIKVEDDTGIVFVLLPGGTFTMGAQKDDPNGGNYDPLAEDDETPHRVTLSPFFLARHELTQGQWKRLTSGGQPSGHSVGESHPGNPMPVGWTHPVEQIDWFDAERWLRRHGLTLPTEAQWEHGCRAGTTSAWWTGEKASSLAGACNALDQYGARMFPNRGVQEGDFDDGSAGPMPVGSYRGNAFGLFDVHGNVWEWTRDGRDEYDRATRAGDGLRGDPAGSRYRGARGGSFYYPARTARCANRNSYAPSFRHANLGTRVARIIQP